MEKNNQSPVKDPKIWTVEGFLNEFMRIHKTMEDRSFAFLIGSGASVTSGIPAAKTLATIACTVMLDTKNSS